MIASLARYWNTLRYLKPIQVYGRLWFRLYRPRPDLKSAPDYQKPGGTFVEPCRRSPSLIGSTQFEFLGETGMLADTADWNHPDKSKLWLYNLHYFNDLNALGCVKRTAWHRALIARWIVENPPALGVGWEPYPTSLRIVNWVKWTMRSNAPPPECLHSLAIQARWLCRRLERYLLGNHLFANAKALVFAGLFFSGDEASGWYRAGMRLLDGELQEQVLKDGGHFERSPMYHLIILEDLLDMVNIHKVFGISYPPQWDVVAGRMLRWSRVMRHPDGGIPFFNDAAFGIAPEPEQLDRYARDIGVECSDSESHRIYHFDQSGYARLEAGDAVLLVDMAPVGPDYLPAHAHADSLSFEWSLGVRRVVVNGGTSVYGSGSERLRQRSTSSHATVVVDGKNSSDVWSGFRVGRRARIIEARIWREGEMCCAVGAHDGYRWLLGCPVHRRMWSLRVGELRVIDDLLGSGRHEVEIVFPLASGLRPNVGKDRSLVTVVDEENGHRVCTLRVTRGINIVAERSAWHQHFGETLETWRLRLLLRGELPLSHETIFCWDRS